MSPRSIRPGTSTGSSTPGVGWALWRDAEALPEELVFKVNYLGGEMPTFALNFSRPGAEVIAQYYTFFRLGFEGMRAVQQASRDVATLAEQIAEMGEFRLITRRAISCRSSPSPPPTTCRAGTSSRSPRGLREHGWQVPAYTFPDNRTDLAVLRVVCRNGFSQDLADLFLRDLRDGRCGPRRPRTRGQARPAAAGARAFITDSSFPSVVDVVPTPPSGEQYDLRLGEQSATVVEVGGGDPSRTGTATATCCTPTTWTRCATAGTAAC